MHKAREQGTIGVDAGLLRVFAAPLQGVTRPRGGAVQTCDVAAKPRRELSRTHSSRLQSGCRWFQCNIPQLKFPEWEPDESPRPDGGGGTDPLVLDAV